jgi:hypothetical protein
MFRKLLPKNVMMEKILLNVSDIFQKIKCWKLSSEVLASIPLSTA